MLSKALFWLCNVFAPTKGKCLQSFYSGNLTLNLSTHLICLCFLLPGMQHHSLEIKSLVLRTVLLTVLYDTVTWLLCSFCKLFLKLSLIFLSSKCCLKFNLMIFIYAVLGLVTNEEELSLNDKETKVMTIIKWLLLCTVVTISFGGQVKNWYSTPIDFIAVEYQFFTCTPKELVAVSTPTV